MTKRSGAQPKTRRRRSTPASASSRSSHSRAPTIISRPLVVFAALVAILAALILLLPAAASSSPSPVVEHMQRIFHRAAAPLLTNNASPPFVSRLQRLFAQNTNNAASSPYSTKPTTMSSAPDANTVDADSFHPKSNNDDNNNNNNEEPVLPLPAPGQEGGSAEALQLNLGGDGVKLDALGPMVVNTDGSLSRIANWERMAEIEKRNTLRVIGKRNKERLARLRGE